MWSKGLTLRNDEGFFCEEGQHTVCSGPQSPRIQVNQSLKSKQTLTSYFFFNSVSTEKPRYAESWDFEVSGSSFLQFELSMGCSKSTSFSHGVRLEYSTDCGHHWSLITPECVPPAIGCAGYTQSSIYTSTQYKHWRRITVYLPSAAKYVL